MSGARLRYILGCAALGALAGAVYGYYLYDRFNTESLSVYQTDKSVDEPVPTRSDKESSE